MNSAVTLNLGGIQRSWIVDETLNDGYLAIVAIDDGTRGVVCIDRRRALLGNRAFQDLTEEQFTAFQGMAG